MNDPHVVALLYRVEHGESVSYNEAEPLVHDEPAFRLKVEEKLARFEFRKHYATEEEAREVIEDYIRDWEFSACLENGPNSFRLKFQKAEIIDRNPTPDVIDLGLISLTGEAGQLSAKLILGFRSYPSPPSDIVVTPDVESMYQRYIRHHSGREGLESMAYFCLSMLEDPPSQTNSQEKIYTKKRKDAAENYQIDKDVLAKIGYLSSAKGGRTGARKREGVSNPLTNEERPIS